jgi:hypothetical protein
MAVILRVVKTGFLFSAFLNAAHLQADNFYLADQQCKVLEKMPDGWTETAAPEIAGTEILSGTPSTKKPDLIMIQRGDRVFAFPKSCLSTEPVAHAAPESAPTQDMPALPAAPVPSEPIDPAIPNEPADPSVNTPASEALPQLPIAPESPPPLPTTTPEALPSLPSEPSPIEPEARPSIIENTPLPSYLPPPPELERDQEATSENSFSKGFQNFGFKGVSYGAQLSFLSWQETPQLKNGSTSYDLRSSIIVFGLGGRIHYDFNSILSLDSDANILLGTREVSSTTTAITYYLASGNLYGASIAPRLRLQLPEQPAVTLAVSSPVIWRQLDITQPSAFVPNQLI